jgi:hypothetical protein
MTDPMENEMLTDGVATLKHEDAKIPPSRRGKQYKCGICHELGHNRYAARLGLFRLASPPPLSFSMMIANGAFARVDGGWTKCSHVG